jgi:hypothetical protein
MNDIRRVLRAAAWRLSFVEFLRGLVVMITVVLASAIVTRLVQQGFRLDLPWKEIAYWAGAGAVFGAFVWTIVRRADRFAVARRVDDGAHLRETLSTALCVAGSSDPWARVTVESAAQKARTVSVRQAVPIQSPRFWPVPLALALSLFVVWIAVPPIGASKAIAAEKNKAQLLEVKAEAEARVQKIEDAVAKLNLGEAPRENPEGDKPEPRTPEEARVAAIKEISSITQRLEEFKASDKGLKADAIKNAMSKLKNPGEGPLSEMSRELAKGNFAKAMEDLAKAMEKMQSGEMSDKEKAAMGEQLAKLAEQLDKLAKDRKDLEKALEKAGINKELAKDPKALAEALKNAQNLTEEQKKQLADMAKSMESACKSCNGMAGSLAQIAQGMGKEGLSKEAMEALSEMAGELSELEMLSGEMDMADAAMMECKAQLEALASFCESGQCEGMGECEGDGDGPEKTGPWKPGWSERQGNGSGGPGRGRGGAPGEREAAFDWEKQKFKTKNTGGPIIGTRFVEGGQVRGESVIEFAGAVAAADQSATEAIDNNIIPREYHEAIKHYFGRLKAKTEGVKSTEPVGPPPEDAEDAGDGGSGK